MAQELGEFAPLVGSRTALLPCLTTLAGTEETVVRDAAVASIVKCVCLSVCVSVWSICRVDLIASGRYGPGISHPRTISTIT